MFFKHVQQQTSCIIFYFKWDLVLYNCPSVLAQHTESSSWATKGKCPGESLETREGFREESREEFRVESREEFIALSTGEWQPVMAQWKMLFVSSQLVTVLHGNCCKWKHSENGNKNEYFLLSEHSIFGGCGSFRDRQIFKMRFFTGLKGTLKAAARLFRWWRAVDLWRRNWNYFKYRVWWKIHDKQFKTLDVIYFIWIP